MIGTLIRHWVLDTGINVMFDNLISNFQVIHTPTHYLDGYWTALDPDDGTIVAWGRCIEESAGSIVLDSECGEFMVPLDAYVVVASTEEQISLLDGDDMTDEEMLQALNEDNRINWRE